MAIRNQPTDEINQKVLWTSVSGVLDLRDVFELVNDGFYGSGPTSNVCPDLSFALHDASPAQLERKQDG